MRTIRIIGPAVLAGLLLVSCGGREREAGAPPILRVGHVGHDHHIALYVAALDPEPFRKRCGVWLSEKKPREIYDLVQHGEVLAELHLSKVGGGSKMPAAMERGDLDVGFGGIAAEVFFIDKGDDFRVISPLNVDGDMLLVRPDFPATDWAGFVKAVRESPKPVRIGYKAPVAVARLVFQGALASEGIPWGEAGEAGGVELVNLRGAAHTVPSLEKGIVDGAVINEPFGSLAVRKKAGRIVSLLADLPPEGRWKAHPCCCICATEAAIRDHRPALVAFLRLIHSSTNYILENPERAAELASRWTKVDLAVEQRSVPNIAYLAEFTDAYRKGLRTWFDMMKELGQFHGCLKDLDADAAFALTHDTSLIEEAIRTR